MQQVATSNSRERLDQARTRLKLVALEVREHPSVGDIKPSASVLATTSLGAEIAFWAMAESASAAADRAALGMLRALGEAVE